MRKIWKECKDLAELLRDILKENYFSFFFLKNQWLGPFIKDIGHKCFRNNFPLISQFYKPPTLERQAGGQWVGRKWGVPANPSPSTLFRAGPWGAESGGDACSLICWEWKAWPLSPCHRVCIWWTDIYSSENSASIRSMWGLGQQAKATGAQPRLKVCFGECTDRMWWKQNVLQNKKKNQFFIQPIV